MTKENLQQILFVDIETASLCKSYNDLDSDWKKLWDSQFFKDENVSSKSPEERYLLKASLKPEFSKIICLSIGVVTFKENVPHIYVKTLHGDEKDILNKFTTTVKSGKYTILGAHNGKSFDFPFILKRMLINKMEIPAIVDFRNKKPWEITAVDTQEMWRIGDAAYPSLDLLAKIFDIPLKDGVDGSQVHDLYYSGQMDKIVKYCGLDVVRLIRVYVKLTWPTLDIENYTLA